MKVIINIWLWFFVPWEYGTCNNLLARRHRRRGNVQMLLRKEYWHDFNRTWWPSFKPQTFEEIGVCPHCGSNTVERFSGDEGWTFCSDGCGCLEGAERTSKFECSICREFSDEPKCLCYEGKFKP